MNRIPQIMCFGRIHSIIGADSSCRRALGRFCIRAVVAASLALLCACQSHGPSDDAQNGHVAGVIDGDTIELADGRTVRLIGIDTPERGDRYFDSASALVSLMTADKTIQLEFDRDRIDRYGRTLAFIWVDDVLVNREVLRAGWGSCYFFEGNLKYARSFLRAQREAMAADRGLWADTIVETADQYRASFLSHRFHRPECSSLSRIEPGLEVVFESKIDAFYDGYSPCGRCLP